MLLRSSAILLVLGAGMLIAFNLLPSEVDPDGILQESFWLIPTGLALLAGSIILAAIKLAILLRHKQKSGSDSL